MISNKHAEQFQTTCTIGSYIHFLRRERLSSPRLHYLLNIHKQMIEHSVVHLRTNKDKGVHYTYIRREGKKGQYIHFLSPNLNPNPNLYPFSQQATTDDQHTVRSNVFN